MTQQELQELLHYDPLTGDFTWKVRSAHRIKIGDKAGFIAKDGYVFIRIKGVLHYAHRLAFLYMTGAWPSELVDHDNRNKSDNTWTNLIPASPLQNVRNCTLSKNNKSGVNGVFWDKRRSRWCASITIDRAGKFLGYFTELPLAVQARKAAEAACGFHPNHGLPT